MPVVIKVLIKNLTEVMCSPMFICLSTFTAINFIDMLWNGRPWTKEQFKSPELFQILSH